MADLAERTEERALIHVLQTENLRLVAENARQQDRVDSYMIRNGEDLVLMHKISLKMNNDIQITIYKNGDGIPLHRIGEGILDIIYTMAGDQLPDRTTISWTGLEISGGKWTFMPSNRFGDSGEWELHHSSHNQLLRDADDIVFKLLQYAQDHNILDILIDT